MSSEANRQIETRSPKTPTCHQDSVDCGSTPGCVGNNNAKGRQHNNTNIFSLVTPMEFPNTFISLSRHSSHYPWLAMLSLRMAAGRRLSSLAHQGKNSSDATIVMAAARLQLSSPLPAWHLSPSLLQTLALFSIQPTQLMFC